MKRPWTLRITVLGKGLMLDDRYVSLEGAKSAAYRWRQRNRFADAVAEISKARESGPVTERHEARLRAHDAHRLRWYRPVQEEVAA